MKEFNDGKMERITHLENKKRMIENLGSALIAYLTVDLEEEIRFIKSDQVSIEELVDAQGMLQHMEQHLDVAAMARDSAQDPTQKATIQLGIDALVQQISKQQERVSWLQKAMECGVRQED